MNCERILPFVVSYVSSEMDMNPASNLSRTSPHSSGWISLPNPQFPLEIVLDFGQTLAITQLKFISHQSKIASNINLSIGKEGSGWQRTNFIHIDSFQFTDNRLNNFKAREIRIAHLPSMKMRYIKLSITGIHSNKYNKNSQVGIVSIAATGYSDDNLSEDEELIELEKLKQDAIDHENFDEAKELKRRIDNIKENKALIADIKQRKLEAIQNENYDLAKRLKMQEDQILSGNDIYSDYTHGYQGAHMDAPYQGGRQQEYGAYGYGQQFEPEPIGYSRRSSLLPEPGRGFDDVPPPSDAPLQHPLPAQGQGRRRSLQEMEYGEEVEVFANPEERPIHGRPPRLPDFREAREEERPIRGQPSEPFVDDGDDALEELTDIQRQEAGPVLAVAGEESVQKFFSRGVSHRIEGIMEISAEIQNMKRGAGQARAYERFCAMLSQRMKENVAGVFFRAVDELMQVTDQLKPSSESVRAAFEASKNAVAAKFGNSNSRMMRSAVEFFQWAADHPALGVPAVAPVVLSPLKQSVQWNAVMPRLEIIQSMIKNYGLFDGCFDANMITQWCLKPLESPKAEIRTTAQNILQLICECDQKAAVIRVLQQSNLQNQKRIIDLLK